MKKPGTSVRKTRNFGSYNQSEQLILPTAAPLRGVTPDTNPIDSFYLVRSTRCGKALMRICPPSGSRQS